MFECVKSVFGARRHWLGGVAFAALLATSAQAQVTYSVDVRPTGLEPALLALASQTHQQIIFAKPIVAGRRAPAVKGVLTPEQALAQLLAGSDLRARRISTKLIVVERAAVATGARTIDNEGAVTGPFGGSGTSAATTNTPVATASPDAGAVVAPRAAVVDEVVVTGSNLRGVPTASPLLSLGQEELRRSGQTTIADVVKALPQNFAGGATDSTASTGADRVGRNSAFGTGVNLRGLGNSATLVLVNGRRVAGSGNFGDFVDLSTIPSTAVERVEILLDGASAVYGADAVGGVVNVILRRDYDGAQTRLLAGSGTAGEPREAQISQTFGTRWAGGGLLFAYEGLAREALPGSARVLTASADLRPFGGTDQRAINAFPGNVLLADPATGANVPTYAIPSGQSGVGLRPTDFLGGVVNLQNQRVGIDVSPKQVSQSVYLAVDQQVGERLQLSADARYGFRRYQIHQSFPVSTLTVTRANPFYVSPVGAASQSLAYSFADLPFPVQSGSAETLTLTAGAKLKLGGDWRADGYAAFGQEIDEARTRGALLTTALSEALGTTADRPDTAYSPTRDGYYNPFAGQVGANSPAVLAFIGSGFTANRSRSRVFTANAQADGTLMLLPGGALKLAVGGQARRETFVRGGAHYVTTMAPTPIAATDVSRDVVAAFAELRAPLIGPRDPDSDTPLLDLTIAGRVEHYEAVGTTANPKVGVVWTPAAGLRVRATYGRSFRAPALRELYDAPAYSPSLLTLGTTRIRTLQLGGGNPDLRPETARSWTGGFDLTEIGGRDLSLSVSGFDIRFKNRIDRPVIANILGALSDPNLTPFVSRISPATSAADLARISALLASPALSTTAGVFPPEAYGAIVETRFVNTSALRVRGLDATGVYRFDVGADRVMLSANASYMLDYKQQTTPTSAVIERIGIASFPAKFRGRASLDWTHGPVTVGIAVNHTSAFRDMLGARIRPQTTFDLQARVEAPDAGLLEGVSVSLNVRNVFDRAPPFYNNPFGVGYDPSNGDIVGRYAFVQLTKTW